MNSQHDRGCDISCGNNCSYYSLFLLKCLHDNWVHKRSCYIGTLYLSYIETYVQNLQKWAVSWQRKWWYLPLISWNKTGWISLAVKAHDAIVHRRRSHALPLESKIWLLNPVNTSCFGFHQLPLLWFHERGGGGVGGCKSVSDTKEGEVSLKGKLSAEQNICVLVNTKLNIAQLLEAGSFPSNGQQALFNFCQRCSYKLLFLTLKVKWNWSAYEKCNAVVIFNLGAEIMIVWFSLSS